MNGNEMRVLMEKIGRSQINEGYEDRVNKVVSWFSKEYPEGITKSQFMQTIEKRSETLANMLDIVELQPKNQPQWDHAARLVIVEKSLSKMLLQRWIFVAIHHPLMLNENEPIKSSINYPL